MNELRASFFLSECVKKKRKKIPGICISIGIVFIIESRSPLPLRFWRGRRRMLWRGILMLAPQQLDDE